MPRKLRKSSTINKSDVNPNKENKKESNNLSLPVLSEEKIFSGDKSQTKSKSKDESVPQFLIPKVRLTCLPLNIEKVIDLTTNKIVKNGNVKKKYVKKRGTNVVEKTKKLVTFKPVEVKTCRNLRPRFKDEEEYRYLYNSPSSKLNAFQKKIKIYIKESKFTLRKSSVVSCKNNQLEEINSDMQNLEDKTENFKQQKNLSKVEVKKAVINSEVNNIDIDLAYDLGNVKNDEFEMKKSESVKSQADCKVKSQSTFNKPVTPCSEENSSSSCLDPNHNVSNDLKSTCLQNVINCFINNSQVENQKDIAALKKGLCLTWMFNNYKCTSGVCPYHHNATKLFNKKLKLYSFKHIMTILLGMKNDTLFVDAVLAAFQNLSERKAPTTWVTFLIYFVFYMTEPCDSRFFKFWASAARFFYRLGENFAAAKGFASLLSIFSHGDKPAEWKILEFIKFIKKPPIQIHPTYDLLQPVLKLNLPSHILVEAVECSIATEKDVLEVYSLIVPKISIMTSPIPVIELLLKFCNTLESLHQEHLAIKLKQKLREKVQTFKIRIFYKDYPLTANFQEEVFSHSDTESNHLIESGSCNVNSDSHIVLRKNNYFQPENDFYNIIRALEIKSGNLPGSFDKVDHKKTELLSKEDGDLRDGQVTRVKQFFADCHFDVLGKYLNGLRPEAVEETVQEFLKALFQMKITLQQVLDLVKIILLHSLSETANKINASICITLIVNLVKINEWEKAHTILSLCEEKRINLIEGKVYLNEFSVLTQLRILLLIVEIYVHKENFQAVLNIVKTHFLYSANSSLWKVAWNNNDEAIRVRILEELLAQTISKQLTNIAYDLFMLTWVEQHSLVSPIDLGKFTNEILILLLNQNVNEGVKFFEKIRGKVALDETATRAILVTFAGANNLQEAKNILAINQTIYTLPEITPDGATVTVSSLWLEEEIYVVLDTLFDMLTSEMNPALRNYENFEVNINVVKPKAVHSSVRPLCLGLINSSLEHACKRIDRVLQHQFQPSIKLIILPYNLILDKPSLQLYLKRRFHRAPG